MASLTALNMPSQIFLPSFIPASKSNAQSTDKTSDNLDDHLDFDLLAEYLLDDGTGTTNDNLVFDFGPESPPDGQQQQSLTVVSPELGSTLVPSTTLVDGSMVNISAAQPALAANVATTITTAPLQTTTLPVTLAPAPTTQAILAPAPAAPAPIGMTAPPILPGIAPSPGAPKQLIVHQHKRPRLDNTTPNTQQPIPLAQAQVQVQHQTQVSSQNMPLAHLTSNAIAPAGIPQRTNGRQKSQAQIDRRRERNRILARRTRLRKKFFFESLQKEVMELQRENLSLKEIVKSRLDPAASKTLLAECRANEELPDVVIEHCGDPSALGTKDFNLMSSIKASQQSFVITDPSLQDNPIVYASDGFLALTGYSRDQVLGRNCRFLQGEETSQAKVAQIRKAILAGDDVSVTFINYMADGTAFWNKLFIAALRDAQNNIVNYIGVTVKVAGPEQGDIEAGKVLPGQVVTDGSQQEKCNGNSVTNGGESPVDVDAAIMAIEGAVEKTLAAAPNVVKTVNKTLP